MTLGERIQALRKEAGLSQEELGEKLGVARQSVSKWESGSTIPELDKFIAMSKLFGVSVGTILGLEEEEGRDHELTDRELKALEAIAQRLTPPPAPTRKRRKWPYVLAALALLAAGMALQGRMQRLENQMSTLYSSIDGVNRNVSGQINSLTGQVRDILESQNSVTADQGYVIEDMDPAGGTVTFRLTAVPRQYEEGMTARFTAAGPGFDTVTAAAAEEEGHSFTARLTCPLADDVTLSVAFQSGQTVQNQRLGREVDLLTQSRPDVYGTAWLFGEALPEGRLDFVNDISVNWSAGWLLGEQSDAAVTLEQLELRLHRDGELIWSAPVPLQEDHASVPLELHLTGLTEGTSLSLTAWCTDNYGRSFGQWVDYYRVCQKSDGSLTLEPADVPADAPWED